VAEAGLRDANELTLLEHLEELRARLLRSALAVAVGMVAGWLLAPPVLDWLIRSTVGHATVMSPVEALGERFRLALFLGAVVAAPAVLYQVWAFIVPGLLRRERRLILPLVAGSLLLFAVGVATSILLVVPIAMKALNVFLTPAMTPQFRLTYVLGFVYNLSLATGIVFELPLAVAVLTLLRVVSSRFLLKRWRLAIVGAVVVSALVTPGDVVVAQFLLGLPLLLLYALSVLVALVLERAGGRRGPALLDSWAESAPAERE
jgi:sec-independent protein translocase protein TatC